VKRAYNYGLAAIGQRQAGGTTFYGYDGHGSVRVLTDATATITDRYDYDAFGVAMTSETGGAARSLAADSPRIQRLSRSTTLARQGSGSALNYGGPGR
jgi:hypothetical protein